jgi:hypothetical protein
MHLMRVIGWNMGMADRSRRFVDARPGVALPPRFESGPRLLAGDVAPRLGRERRESRSWSVREVGSLIFSSRLAIKPFALPENSSFVRFRTISPSPRFRYPPVRRRSQPASTPPTPIGGRCPRRPRPGEAQTLRRGTRTCSRVRSSSVTSSRSTARVRRSAIASSLSSASRPLGSSSRTARSLRPMIAVGTGLSLC